MTSQEYEERKIINSGAYESSKRMVHGISIALSLAASIGICIGIVLAVVLKS